jgi:hypothetical protein
MCDLKILMNRSKKGTRQSYFEVQGQHFPHVTALYETVSILLKET